MIRCASKWNWDETDTVDVPCRKNHIERWCYQVAFPSNVCFSLYTSRKINIEKDITLPRLSVCSHKSVVLPSINMFFRVWRLRVHGPKISTCDDRWGTSWISCRLWWTIGATLSSCARPRGKEWGFGANQFDFPNHSTSSSTCLVLCFH